MGKNLYSLILTGEVVDAVDRLAYERGLSRSGLIDQILAEYLSLTIPEKHIEMIFREITSITASNNTLQIPAKPSGTMLQVKSVLRYKYNPTIRYSVEISPQSGDYSGFFRVVSRTQSGALKYRLNDFFEIWDRVEHLCYQRSRRLEPEREISDGRYARRLCLDQQTAADPQCLGRVIGEYIQLFDKALAHYFTMEDAPEAGTYETIYQLYESYLQSAGIYL